MRPLHPHMLVRAMLVAALGIPFAGSAWAGGDLNKQITVGERGLIVTPGSSRLRADGTAHTRIHGLVRYGRPMGTAAPDGTSETPASLACVYKVVTPVTGCNPETVTAVATGGSRTIAIVDAYDDPTAAHDLGVFSAQFGLPAITSANFEVVYATTANGIATTTTKRPAADPTGGWEVEESLDIEMAHSLAPNAKIILVEAASASNAALMAAEQVAVQLVSAAGGGEVSNSWGSSEMRGETGYEADFTANNVVVFASAGDSPGAEFPAVLPNVVAVGGTTINRTSAGNYTSQSTWKSGGGGLSALVAIPSFQSRVASVVGTKRGTPDIALDANPDSGVWVYDSTPYDGQVLGWSMWGGTSVASPLAASLTNAAGSFAASTKVELTKLYGNLGKTADFTDIVSGSCPNAKHGASLVGYDLCTGIGAPAGTAGE